MIMSKPSPFQGTAASQSGDLLHHLRIPAPGEQVEIMLTAALCMQCLTPGKAAAAIHRQSWFPHLQRRQELGEAKPSRERSEGPVLESLELPPNFSDFQETSVQLSP